jgi:hypothetical protein
MVHFYGEDHRSIRAVRSVRFIVFRPQLCYPFRRSSSIQLQPRSLLVPSTRPVPSCESLTTSNPNLSVQFAFLNHWNASIASQCLQSLFRHGPFFCFHFRLLPAFSITAKNAVFLRLWVQIPKYYGFNCTASRLIILPSHGHGWRRRDAMQVLEKLKSCQGAYGAVGRNVRVCEQRGQDDWMGLVVI